MTFGFHSIIYSCKLQIAWFFEVTLTDFSTAVTNLYDTHIKFADTDKLVYTSSY